MIVLEHFDAAAAADPASTRPLLEDPATRDLLDYFEETEEELDRLTEEEAAEPLDPDLIAMFEELTSADDAPPAFRTLRARVHSGATSWHRFWLHPEDEYRGLELIALAMRTTSAEVDGLLDSLPDLRRLPERPDGGPAPK